MNEKDYLDRLRKQLKGISKEEQDDLLAEIASHIESGQEDAAMDANHLIQEMDSPEQMGRGLRRIHRPDRWVNLALILVPYYIASPLVQLILLMIYGSDIERKNVQDPLLYLGTRIAILLFIGLALVGSQRHSPILMLFWAIDAVGSLISLMMREARFIPGYEKIPNSEVQSIVLYLVLLGLLYWVFRILKQYRFNPLLVVFAMLPLVSLGFRLGTQGLFYQDGLLNYNSVFQYSYQIVWVASIAMFILFRQPDVRWFGLLLHSLNYIYIEMLIYKVTLPLILVYAGLPLMVILPWALDLRRRYLLRRQVE